ncbi:MAG: hypothetical protein E6Q97_00720 [Desulfurellales bacterium]|nr:MAG: hypothetical protein E6Q97_00720 [Desulfurellales bacterium]
MNRDVDSESRRAAIVLFCNQPRTAAEVIDKFPARDPFAVAIMLASLVIAKRLTYSTHQSLSYYPVYSARPLPKGFRFPKRNQDVAEAPAAE